MDYQIIKPDPVFKSAAHNKANERAIVDDLNKKTFFAWMADRGFNEDRLCEIFDSKRISGHEQNQFNIAIRTAKIQMNIDIMDCVLYLEEFAVRFRKLISILDSQTVFLLKKELSDRYRIGLDTNNLSQIFGKEDES